MASFRADGVELFYEVRGSGPPAVFVHGTLCDYRSWSGQTDALSARYKTLAYSRRYAFPNARNGDVMDSTVQNNAADLAALINGLGMEKPHVVGHSFGGFVAAFFAIQYPNLLRSLTLINAAVATMVVPDNRLTTQLGLLLRSPRVALSANRLISGTKATIKAYDAGDSEAANRILVPAIQNRRTDLPKKTEGFSKVAADNARTARETTTPFPLVTKREAGGIKTPTLVMWGELSAPWDFKISKMLSESIPGCEASKIRGAGHFCPNEKPAEVSERISSFLERH